MDKGLELVFLAIAIIATAIVIFNAVQHEESLVRTFIAAAMS